MTENQQVLYAQHEVWIKEPLTLALLAALRKHEQSITETIANSAMAKDTTDEQIRRYATQLSTTKHIYNLIYDTPTFAIKCCRD